MFKGVVCFFFQTHHCDTAIQTACIHPLCTIYSSYTHSHNLEIKLPFALWHKTSSCNYVFKLFDSTFDFFYYVLFCLWLLDCKEMFCFCFSICFTKSRLWRVLWKVRNSRKHISVNINQFCVQYVAGNLRQASYRADVTSVVHRGFSTSEFLNNAHAH